MTGILVGNGISNLPLFSPATLEDSQYISGLGNLPTLQRIKVGQHALLLCLLRSWWRPSNQPLRLAIARVAFAEARILDRISAIVIKRSAPKHGTVSHHAGAHLVNFFGMASGAAAGLLRDTVIA